MLYGLKSGTPFLYPFSMTRRMTEYIDIFSCHRIVLKFDICISKIAETGKADSCHRLDTQLISLMDYCVTHLQTLIEQCIIVDTKRIDLLIEYKVILTVQSISERMICQESGL